MSHLIAKIFNSVAGQAGIVFIVVGLAAAVGAMGYRIGTPARMGPGFFPFCLGVILAFVGLLCLVEEVRHSSETPPAMHWRALLAITAAVIVAATLLLRMGLFVAIPSLVLIASLSRPGLSVTQVAATAVVLTGVAYAVFILGLGMQIPLFTQ